MKSIVLYAYPPEPDGLSQQGDMLYRGMKENGEEAMPCHLSSEFQKEWIYKYLKPDVALGVGFWGHTPDIILHPQKFGVEPVPWLLADGWVANYREILGSLPLVFTTSDWVRKTFERDGVSTKNFVTAYIGLDTELFQSIPKNDPRIKLIREMAGVKENEVMILTAGGDVTSKGAQEIFKALKIVDQEFSAKGGSASDGKNWKYVCKIWGGASADDHYKDEMALIEELGESKDKVVYLEGSMSREFMPLLLNACDIYAAPSRLEGFGMIQVEAMACGKPVISINEMGPKETIIHGETGFLANVDSTVDLEKEWGYTSMGFEERQMIIFDKPKTFAYRANVDEIADYLLKLLTNPELREKMGKAGREHAVQNFEYHKIAREMTQEIKSRLKLS
ncbi:glycosyltransferase family 4 protein [Candidatus Wolfebacteria bacterium]|nr:glycosyltransferase family 4 protein [Candidatus Wolfebacteria bacterium]